MEPALLVNVLGELNWYYEINTGLPAGFIGPFRDTLGNGFPVVDLAMDCDGVYKETIFLCSPWSTDDALDHDLS